MFIDKIKRMLPTCLIGAIQQQRYYGNVDFYIPHNKKKLERIAFIVSFPETWNSFFSVYEAAREYKIDVKIIAVPQKDNNGDFKDNNESELFFNSIGLECVAAYNKVKNAWFDIKNWKPDYVFYTRPYNSEYPLEYQSFTVCKFATICYIPYGFTLKNKYIFDSVFSWSFSLGAQITFVQSIEQKINCEKKFAWQIFKKSHKFVALGYPRFDVMSKKISYKKNKFTVIWMPRWEFENKRGHDGQSTSHFLEYINNWLAYASTHEKMNFILRPHPLMFQTILKEKILTNVQLNELLEKINTASNVMIDNNKDYIHSILQSDVLIADLTSLIVEFFITGKPIIYCDSNKDFNKDAILIEKGLYYAENWIDVESWLEQISTGIDEKKEIRNEIMNKLTCKNWGSIGKNIIEYLIKDCECDERK